MAKLDLAKLVKEVKGREQDPLKIDLGDGGKPVVLDHVPLQLFMGLERKADYSMVEWVLSVLEDFFSPEDWGRLKPILLTAPLEVTSELYDRIFDHFNLRLETADAGKGDEDSTE
ncbi:hypothetical protein [Corynebacterium sp. MC3]|uniref:hypothetical protein n=1 Tax=Corynebacterium sp. MC3 TaxID=1720193 RepID=UPI0008DA1C0C|nr:hypothetical protein [Corynebacterium sp. MC3]